MEPDAQVRSLLELALNSGRSPDEVCSAYPEHLQEVLRRWIRIREIVGDLDCLFPASSAGRARLRDSEGEVGRSLALPRIPGYEMEAVIGQGGMGVVYRARHVRLDRVVAIKMLRSGDHASAQELTGLVREAQAIAGLQHPHIVQVHDVGELGGLPYFTMEFVEGGSLAQKLAGTPQPAMSSAEAVSVLARAVHAAHERGTVHRDLKPGNVLISGDGTLKITDFGLARRLVADGETRVTLAPMRVGTPSYMSPEQALGTADALKPSADIYSLGAVLYEMLTGRPPFRGDSPAETERQVVNDEPVPPSRLNPKTPRDLQTICLKCLHKQPERRYANARELAEDLDRFRKGDPIQARPVGVVELAMKWVRRHPAHAALLIAACVVIATGILFGLWYQSVAATRRAEAGFRETEARGLVQRSLQQAVAAIAVEHWDNADRALVHARERAAEAKSEELDREMASLGESVRIARLLEQTRQSRVLGAAERTSVAESYAAAFRQAGISIDGNMRANAVAIQGSPIRAQLIASLDDWASVEYDLRSVDRCDALLAVVREADPGSAWATRFRTQALWSNRDALLQLAVDSADPAIAPNGPAVHQVGLLGLRLGEAGDTDAGMELLRRVLVQRPTDFWMNWELGLAYLKAGRYREAISPVRTAMALRPENANACAFLAGVVSEAGDLDEGLPLFQRAMAMAPDATFIRRNLVYLLCKNGRTREAREVFSWWQRLDAQGVNALRQFVWSFIETRRYEEALGVIRELRTYDTTDTGVLEDMGECFYELGRFSEAEVAFREDIRLQPNYGYPHSRLCRVLFKAGRIDDAITAAQGAIQRSFPMTSLYPPLGELLLARGRAVEAAAASEHVTKSSPADVPAWIGLARAQLGLRQFEKARSSLDRVATLSPSPDSQKQLARLRELHDRVSELDQEVLSAPVPALDASALLDLAEWNWRCVGNPSLAARQFLAAFAADPRLLRAAGSDSRFHAACSALAAAETLPPSPGGSSSEERARLQSLALDWLSSERDALIARRTAGDGPERVVVAEEFRLWFEDPAIISSCEAPWAGPDTDPDTDKKRWQTLWRDLKEGAARDNPGEILRNARIRVSLSDWASALESYRELFSLQPDQSGDVWFELAAVQVLTDDVSGYRKTCEHLLDSQERSSRIRAYHVARACTLSPLGDADLRRAADIGAREIRSSDAAWALTEKGALFCRAGQPSEAIGLLKRSIDADSRVGMAVLNWLWIAIANNKAGHAAESRRWFAKADTWLQRLGGERPPDDGPSTIHVHDWLEAQILHREAAAALANPIGEGTAVR